MMLDLTYPNRLGYFRRMVGLSKTLVASYLKDIARKKAETLGAIWDTSA